MILKLNQTVAGEGVTITETGCKHEIKLDFTVVVNCPGSCSTIESCCGGMSSKSQHYHHHL